MNALPIVFRVLLSITTLLVILLLQQLLLTDPNPSVGFATTRISEPLRPDGRVDYLEALRRQTSVGVATENNAVVELRAAFGPRGIESELVAGYFNELGVSIPRGEDNYILSLTEFCESLDIEDRPTVPELDRQLELSMTQPWLESDAPGVAQWLELSVEQLATIEDASHRSCSCPPVSSSDGTMLCITYPDVHRRRLGPLSSLRALLNLGQKT